MTLTQVLEPIKKGTKLTLVGDIDRIPYGIPGKIMFKLLIQRVGDKQVERALEKLKDIMEK